MIKYNIILIIVTIIAIIAVFSADKDIALCRDKNLKYKLFVLVNLPFCLMLFVEIIYFITIILQF